MEGPDCKIFLEKWAALRASPKVITILKEGYILPFHTIQQQDDSINQN